MTDSVLNLYAIAIYKGTINVAISFLKEDGKRYFLTHPGGAPRYARARHYDDWTNVRQGIGNADNSNPNYLSSYKIIGKEGECAECAVGEYVLDPRHETMYGAEDSLVFYEDYQPDGTTNVTTETGAGQWGAALSYAAKAFGLECAVYQVKISMQQKPYRSSIMRTFGATVEGSPSMSTRAGKDIITRDPMHPGSLGTAISEAVELATTTPNCKYTLGSVLNHVALHQTVIGLEAENAEGEKCVEELRKAFELVHLYREGENASRTEIEQMSGLKTPQGVIAVFKKPSCSEAVLQQQQSYSDSGKQLTLALDGIQDPGNLGTIIRTCDWFGVHTNHRDCSREAPEPSPDRLSESS